MGNLFKVVAFSAPVLALVIYLSFGMLREHNQEQRADEASFDRSFAKSQEFMAKTPKEKQFYRQEAQIAQSRYSSESIKAKAERDKMDQKSNEIDQAEVEIQKEELKKFKGAK